MLPQGVDTDKERSHADVACSFLTADLIQETLKYYEIYFTCLLMYAVETAAKAKC
jgi:hypothetical protein